MNNKTNSKVIMAIDIERMKSRSNNGQGYISMRK